MVIIAVTSTRQKMHNGGKQLLEQQWTATNSWLTDCGIMALSAQIDYIIAFDCYVAVLKKVKLMIV